MRTGSLLATPATANCAGLLSRGKHVLLGISPFNSRYSDAYVLRLAQWAAGHFDTFDLLLAGDETALQLEAAGTPAGKARYRARRAVRRNRRAADAALHGLGARAPGARILHVSDFYGDPVYEKLRHEAMDAFRADPAFRTACLGMARTAIAGRLRSVHGRDAAISVAQAEHAVPYVFAELPFFVQTPALLGLQESLLAYHRPWELGERIFAGDFSLAVDPAQGYVTVSETALGECP
ncbi:tRNA-dependent cyclodipeptide synthase [Streptomyces sp. A30]|uniref:tRNA-dependent cyclodipeptide synthase n=1 Tax=Streptomyces sp. A30 TaxID=2789273 RepID=UPI00397FD271